MIEYPFWIRKGLLATAVIHDIAIIGAGFLALTGNAPLSLSHSLDHLTVVWGWMLIMGGATSFIGALVRQARMETTGCVVTAAAKLVWVVAALQSGQSDSYFLPGTGILAFVLIAGAAGTMWRFLGLWVGYYLRVRD